MSINLKPKFLTNQVQKQAKKPRLRRNGSIWLNRAESFKMFLEDHPQDPLELPDQTKNNQSRISQSFVEEHYRHLRSERYYLWLQNAESLMYQDSNCKPLKNGILRLMIGLDYKKFYDAVLFEFHHYFSRACFCKLAKHYKVNINPKALNYELEHLLIHLKSLLSENKGITHKKDFQDLYIHAYRSALMDLCLYYNLNLNVMSEPVFSLDALVFINFNDSEVSSIRKSNNQKETFL